jgi:hypothetical protein
LGPQPTTTSSPALPEGEGNWEKGTTGFKIMDHNSSDWTESETTTHQDHVITHVLGATVLGWFIAGEAAHLLLDIGFLWTIYLDGEMNLSPQGVAISELDADELSSADKTEVAFDAQLLLSEGRDAVGLKRFTASPVECLITTVEFLAANSARRIVVQGDEAIIDVVTSLETAEVSVVANHPPG